MTNEDRKALESTRAFLIANQDQYVARARTMLDGTGVIDEDGEFNLTPIISAADDLTRDCDSPLGPIVLVLLAIAQTVLDLRQLDGELEATQ